MITSSANERIKYIRKLRERKYRQESGTFYIEGIRIVREALSHPERVETLLLASELLAEHLRDSVMHEIETAHVPVLEVSASVFHSFGLKENPQGLAAVVRQEWHELASLDPQQMGLWVGLDSIADPGNLGTIMRTTDAVSGRGILLIDNCTDPYDPSAVRGSMGAIFAVDFIKTDTASFLHWKQQHSIPVYGTSDAVSVNYQSIIYPENMVLLMGSEREGLHPELVQSCDQMVALPMAGKSDSLNLAVATGVTLYEIFNQHLKRGKK
jgi:TrmH family RNA methyltransferase